MCSVDETKSLSSNADLARQVAAGRVYLQSLRELSASHFVRCARMSSGTSHTQVRPLQVRHGSIASLVGRMAYGGSTQTKSEARRFLGSWSFLGTARAAAAQRAALCTRLPPRSPRTCSSRRSEGSRLMPTAWLTWFWSQTDASLERGAAAAQSARAVEAQAEHGNLCATTQRPTANAACGWLFSIT